MKVLLLMSTLIFNAFAIDFTMLNTMDSPVLERIANKTQFAMDTADLAPNEMVFKISHNNIYNLSPRKIINDILFDLYIDDQRVIPASVTASELKRISRLLNYNRRTNRDVLRGVKIVETELKALYNDSSLLLFSLETTGYGSFGEGNGFAIYDTISGELIITQAGYAE